MISQERINHALEMFERLERRKREDFSVEDARRRLRILEILGR